MSSEYKQQTIDCGDGAGVEFITATFIKRSCLNQIFITQRVICGNWKEQKTKHKKTKQNLRCS